jgi:activator of HSP90 ATPase
MTVELEQNRSIVQAWRVASWPAATYSIVRFSLQSAGDTTTLTLDQTGFPSGTGEHLDQGWHSMYWEPLKISCMQ